VRSRGRDESGRQSAGVAFFIAASLWLASPAVAADEPLPFKAPPALQATFAPGLSLIFDPYWSNKNVFGADPSTSAHIDQNGAVGVLQYDAANWFVGITGEVGHSHITYLQVLDDMFVSSTGLGARAGLKYGPLTATIGGSYAHDSFRDVQFDTNQWTGREREVHAIVSGHWDGPGPLWLDPMIGFRRLTLDQDAHLLGFAAIIPQDTRNSRLAFAGSRVGLAFRDVAGTSGFKTWVFGGITHEFDETPPMGPSVFLADQVAGNQFTIFPQGVVGTPTPFPSKNTRVVGAGIDADVRDMFVFRLAYYREFNDLFGSVNYRASVGIRW
jgi:hypothetical protein